MLQRFHWKLRQSVRERGVIGTALFSARRVYQKSRPSYRRQRAARRAQELEFDRRHEVETAEPISLGLLDIPSRNKPSGVDYEPIAIPWFETVMHAAETPAEGRTFVDFGCGKGRAMLLASLNPYRRIVGVEFSPRLAAVARRNLAMFRHPARRCHDLEVVLGDAVDFPLPEGPLVLFFFNPFGADVMRRVVERVSASLAADPRPMTVVYCNDAHASLWANVAGLRRTVSEPGHSIYRWD